MGEICEMSAKGDVRTIWNPNVPAEVENARQTFVDMKEKNYEAFRVDESGGKAGRMDKWDAEAGKIIMVPRMVGG